MPKTETSYVLLWREPGKDKPDVWKLLRDAEGKPVVHKAGNNERAAKAAAELFRNLLPVGTLERGIEVWPVPRRNLGAWPLIEKIREPYVEAGKKLDPFA